VTNKKYIIWDWNGTLLNDAEFCVSCMNLVLNKHHLKSIDINTYRNAFTFPVKIYYEAIGFDFNKIDFEVPAMEFIDLYYSSISEAHLHVDAIATLKYFDNKGIKQLALSAMEHENLVKTLSDKGIFNFFDEVRGIKDHFAHSKLDEGLQLINGIGANKDEFLLIGDTIHDYEVASGLGIDCILVSNGHQSEDRLMTAQTKLVSSLAELQCYF
jgi:phosphoglycolate phosphatase